ncbi:MAG TPA: hypothetical protein VKY89_18450 [Thermoanaerobaculia bacterium]|nr:hypothetical protein [Thermoanaerobaculia bacterium]
MGGRVGCWRVVAIAGLAGLLPTFLSLLHPGGGGPVPRLAAPPPACLEAWVRLRSYRGCPLLAAAAGYRLEIHCFWGGHLERSDGTLVFAGPFSGRAFVSSRPVPLGRWVHVAGLAPSLAPLPAIQAAIAFDGRDVTAGRLTADAEPLPLGYDPWEERPPWVKAVGAVARCRGPAAPAAGNDPACRGAVERPDGEIGAWRLSRGWRGLAQVAAARGAPSRLAPLPAPPRGSASGEPAAGGAGRTITARGWKVIAAVLLLALAMAGAGMALRLQHGAATAATAAAGGGVLARVQGRRVR